MARAKSSEVWTSRMAYTEARYRNWGYEMVSWYDHKAQRTHDLLGIIDALGFPVEGGTWGIQFTSTSNVKARVDKIQHHRNLNTVVRAGWRLVVWGFDKATGRLTEVIIH